MESKYKKIRIRYLDGKDVLFHRVKHMRVESPFFIIEDVESVQHQYEKVTEYKIPLDRVQYISEGREDETQ